MSTSSFFFGFLAGFLSAVGCFTVLHPRFPLKRRRGSDLRTFTTVGRGE